MNNVDLKVEHDERQTVAELTRAASETIRRAVFGIQSKILVSFSGPKSGREYKRGGRTHQAAAKGEAPAIDTGFLAATVGAGASFPSATEGRLDIAADYAEAVEVDHPFVAPAIEGMLAELERGGILARLV